VAIGDGEDTAVLAVVDGEGWMWDYATKCERCGAKQLTSSSTTRTRTRSTDASATVFETTLQLMRKE
jgi:hypothetical protein